MSITVYFATNRVITGDVGNVANYSNDIAAPADPNAVTYGTAFVEDASLTADSVGAISSIQDINQGGFAADPAGDLSAPGRNLLIFVHGFDNTFENAITRAAYNQQWLAACGQASASTTVVAFSWPSIGQLLAFPVPWDAYLHDQTMAGRSGAQLAAFFLGLRPIIAAARRSGARITLLAHSMGNYALQSTMENWFANNNATGALFDEVVLAAADERFDSFSYPSNGRLSGLPQLTKRISIYSSTNDQVLKLSSTVNGIDRLGQHGPLNGADPSKFPPATVRQIDCSAYQDYDDGFANSHQYYRMSPSVRADIAAVIGGTILTA